MAPRASTPRRYGFAALCRPVRKASWSMSGEEGEGQEGFICLGLSGIIAIPLLLGLRNEKTLGDGPLACYVSNARSRPGAIDVMVSTSHTTNTPQARFRPTPNVDEDLWYVAIG